VWRERDTKGSVHRTLLTELNLPICRVENGPRLPPIQWPARFRSLSSARGGWDRASVPFYESAMNSRRFRDGNYVRRPVWSLETGPKTVMQITFCPIGFHRELKARYAKKARTFSERNEF